MDNNLARWSQLVFFGHDDIEEIQAYEVRMGLRTDKGWAYSDKGLPTWRAERRIAELTRIFNPDGYWPKAMSLEDRTRSMEDFQKVIFPIWKGIQERDDARDKSATGPIATTVGAMMSEIATMHRQDMAILASGFKPRKEVMTQESAVDLRRKAAAGEKFSHWKGGTE